MHILKRKVRQMISLFDSLLQPEKSVRRHPIARTAKALLVHDNRMLVIALIALIILSMAEHRAEAQVWSLTKAQRQAYLSYYAPVILKRGDENDDKEGRDWLTNFDFDQDNNFSTNRVNWLNVDQYVAASAAHSTTSSYSRWRIRPTIYTALMEYMEGSSKSLVLLYHVYNAADKDGDQIHDWERIEVIVRGVSGTPGSAGETVSSATITVHHEHIMRRSYDSGLNFMQTATGKHVLIWQADESAIDTPFDACSTHAHELRFVTNPYSWIASQMSTLSQAEVNVNNKDEKKNIHYVFVPEGSSAAVSTWGAKPLNYTVASTLYSGVDNGDTVYWYRAKRITYELQDIADILPTHWQGSTWYKHWLSDKDVDVLLESPIINEAGQPEVSAGMQLFYATSRDSGSSSLTDGRNGYPAKEWLFGAYSAELNRDCLNDSDDFPAYSGSGLDSYGRSRGAASGYYNSHGAYWWQHDFFAHSGGLDSSSSSEAGTWLVGAWYTAANGGFDGRWVQLFDDRPGQEPSGSLSVPLNVTVTSNAPSTTIDLYNSDCIPITWTTNISGGTPAYNSTMYENGVSKGARTTYTGSYCNAGTNSSRTVAVSAIVTDSSSPVQSKSASAPTITIRSHAATVTPFNVTVTSNAPSTTIDLYNSDCISITWTTNISGGTPTYNSTMYENGVSKGARTTYTGSYCNAGTNSSRTIAVSATVTDSSSPVQSKSASAPTITIRSHAATVTPFNVTVTSNAPSTIIDLYGTECLSITWTTNISGGTSPYNSTMYLNSVSQGVRTTYSKTYCNAGTNSSITAAASATVTDSSSPVQSKSASAPTITVRSHYYNPSTGCYTYKDGKLILPDSCL
jgi:hypothetical protein